MYHYQKDFRNKTEYVYDTNNKLIEERFYEGEEFELDVLTKYKYNKNGMLLKRTKQDFHFKRKTTNSTQGCEQKTCDCC